MVKQKQNKSIASERKQTNGTVLNSGYKNHSVLYYNHTLAYCCVKFSRIITTTVSRQYAGGSVCVCVCVRACHGVYYYMITLETRKLMFGFFFVFLHLVFTYIERSVHSESVIQMYNAQVYTERQYSTMCKDVLTFEL